VAKEFISCEENCIWLVANGLQKMLKFSASSKCINDPVVPRIPGPLKDVGHVAYCLLPASVVFYGSLEVLHSWT
jgi:hypothetical protein